MNVVLFGATGMVGAGTLLECFADPRVTSVLAVTRSPTGRSHPKLHEVLHADFFDYDTLRDRLRDMRCVLLLSRGELDRHERGRVHPCDL